MLKHEYLPPDTMRLMIGQLQQTLAKVSGRKAKTLRRKIRKAVADSVAALNAERPNALRERRLANIRRREQRDDRILENRNPAAFAARQTRRQKWSAVVKPVFE